MPTMIVRTAPAPTSHPPNASSIRKNHSDILRIMVCIHYIVYGPRWFLKLIFIIRTFTAGNSFRLSDERAAGYSRNPKTRTSRRWALCFQFEWLLCSFATIERCKSFRASRLNIKERRMVESRNRGKGGGFSHKGMIVTHQAERVCISK